MPVNNVGYRNWSGPIRGSMSRWLAIARTGVAVTLKSQWVRRLLFLSWVPVLYFAFGFFFFEKYMEYRGKPIESLEIAPGLDGPTVSGLRRMPGEAPQRRLDPETREIMRLVMNQAGPSRELAGFLQAFPKSDVVIREVLTAPVERARHTTWCWMLMNFFRYPQGFLMLILVGLIVPPLISRDLRSRAYLMYFSRPLGPAEYILGKALIPAAFLALITALPALILYAFGVLLSPGLGVLADTWDIPLRIVVASAVLIVPTSLMALMFSSLTHESRFAAFAWFAAWGLGAGAYIALGVATTASQFSEESAWDAELNRGAAVHIDPQEQIERAREAERLAEGEGQSRRVFNTQWSFVSIYSTVGRVQEWVFGLETSFASVAPLLGLLAAIAVVSSWVLYRRVTGPINA